MLADTKTKNGIGYEMHFSSVQYTINSSQKRKSVGKTLIIFFLYNETRNHYQLYIYTQVEFHMEQYSAPRVLRLIENSSFSVTNIKKKQKLN